jgi:uncharacterized protein (TIGR02246 family)
LPKSVVPDLAALATQAALRSLAEGYARAVDRGDGDAFAELFAEDGALRKGNGDVVGRAALARVPATVAATYTHTQHFLGQSTYEIGDGVATGEVYCTAHEVSARPEGGETHWSMFIRYADHYRQGADGTWRFEERRVQLDWMESRIVDI